MTEVIAVDIDDTLYSFNQLARAKFAEIALAKGDKKLHRGAYCSWSEWRSLDDVTADQDGLCSEIISLCHRPETVLEQRPYDGAVDTLLHATEDDYELIYISNRDPSSLDATQIWLDTWEFPAGELICTWESKLKHVSHCQYIIDDRPKTLVEFVYDYKWKETWGSDNKDKQRQGFGIFGEYNRALTDVPNIYLAPNWLLLEFYLVERGVLSERRNSPSERIAV